MAPMTEDIAAMLAESAQGKPAPRAPAVRKFSCPACGGEIALRAMGHTLTAVCAHCGSVVDTSDARLKVVQEVKAKTRKTLIEIGQRGKVRGVAWEVIGYTQKSDKTQMYLWDEYLLFNPWHGFRFLGHMDGHWNFITVVKEDFDRMGFVSTVWWEEHKFDPFLRDQPIVQYVKGEFYWRVKKGDRAVTEDYICPPYMLSFETTDGDITASLCEYIEPEDVKAAFDIQYAMPAKKGVGPNQPSPFNLRGLAIAAALALFVATLVHGVNLLFSARETLARVHTLHNPADRATSFAGPVVSVPAQSNVEVFSHAPVSNSWVELDISLVNEATKESYELGQAIEYYYGYDSDGSWSEGGTTRSDFLSAVPAGDYRLVYDVSADAFAKGRSQEVTVMLKRDVPSWGNYLWTALLIVLYPLFVWMRAGAYETKRWENSDFPRGGGDDDE